MSLILLKLVTNEHTTVKTQIESFSGLVKGWKDDAEAYFDVGDINEVVSDD